MPASRSSAQLTKRERLEGDALEASTLTLLLFADIKLGEERTQVYLISLLAFLFTVLHFPVFFFDTRGRRGPCVIRRALCTLQSECIGPLGLINIRKSEENITVLV